MSNSDLSAISIATKLISEYHAALYSSRGATDLYKKIGCSEEVFHEYLKINLKKDINDRRAALTKIDNRASNDGIKEILYKYLIFIPNDVDIIDVPWITDVLENNGVKSFPVPRVSSITEYALKLKKEQIFELTKLIENETTPTLSKDYKRNFKSLSEIIIRAILNKNKNNPLFGKPLTNELIDTLVNQSNDVKCEKNIGFIYSLGKHVKILVTENEVNSPYEYKRVILRNSCKNLNILACQNLLDSVILLNFNLETVNKTRNTITVNYFTSVIQNVSVSVQLSDVISDEFHYNLGNR